MTLLETLGAILVGLIILAGAALGLNSAFSSSKLGETEQNLITLRMQVQQMFSGKLLDAGVAANPPWTLLECTLFAAPTPGRVAKATLVFSTVERASTGN